MSLFRIKSLAKAQATQAEIEAVVGYPCNGPDEQEAIATGRLQGVAELREVQYTRAMKGDTAALNALGKHLLGQTGEGVQININITDILKRAQTLRSAAGAALIEDASRSSAELLEVDPPGEKREGSGAALLPHTEKNSENEN